MYEHHRLCGKAFLVDLESPFAGDVEKNLQYARRCMRDSILRGEKPLASHLLYTQDGILDDNVPEERQLGIEAGKFWSVHADTTVVYMDLGVSRGMEYGIEDAKKNGRRIVYRWLDSPNNNTEPGCHKDCKKNRESVSHHT